MRGTALFDYDDVQAARTTSCAAARRGPRWRSRGQQTTKQLDELREPTSSRHSTHLPNVTADVIGGPVTNFEHTIELDKGSDAGIHVGMPVRHRRGLVGRVVQVPGGRSVVKLLTDPDFVVGVRFATSQGDGLAARAPATAARWSSTKDRPEGDGARPTRLVTTSGYDRAIFPTDIPVGDGDQGRAGAEPARPVAHGGPARRTSVISRSCRCCCGSRPR